MHCEEYEQFGSDEEKPVSPRPKNESMKKRRRPTRTIPRAKSREIKMSAQLNKVLKANMLSTTKKRMIIENKFQADALPGTIVD